MHGYCSLCIPYFINFLFCAFFFSLFSLQKKLTSLLIIFFFRYTQTQTNPHTITNTQTNHHRRCLVLIPCPGQALRVELQSYKDEFNSVGQGSEYSKGAMDFGSKSKETQRRRGVPLTEEEHRYKILIVFFVLGVMWVWSVMWVLIVDRWCGLDRWCWFWLVLLDWSGIVVLVMVVVLMECLWWCFWVLTVGERGRKERRNDRDKEKERKRKKKKNRLMDV